ncbi:MULTISPECIES: hypothetical protein [Vibrio]|uniref:hypothetical protein n=1 Tax=Vibrio TaxID=662 RepID=UPI0009763A04|nr:MULTISPECIES: hypothetical protein [Vibrio]OMO23052.1 hypothetical protein BH583_06970 [Vibrio lentus]PMN13523.1 hypothetical protein BCT38_20555 [Vibrio lentus]PTO86580.1 hypothetical protein CWO29_18295 [Vibrio splendidus]
MNKEEQTKKLHSVEANSKTPTNGIGKEGNSSPTINDDKINSEAYEEKRKLLSLFMLFSLLLMILTSVSIANRGIYQISEETLIVINQAFNALVVLLIPFILGSIGAMSRILMSGISVAKQVSLIISSGLMATFSWIGIKSGVLLAIVAPHLEKQGVEPSVIGNTPSNFYTMALVAIFVGMFSSNLYLFINQRVEQLTMQARQTKPAK